MSIATSRLNVLIARMEGFATRDCKFAREHGDSTDAGFRADALIAAEDARTYADVAAALNELRNLRLLAP